MTSATEELRRLLDERGVEHEGEDFKRYAYTYWGDWSFMEPLDAKPHTLGDQCELMLIPATPEQAIAATLGGGTLQAENTKLRELVRSFHSAMCCMFETGTWPTDPKWLEELMEELRVEVHA